jgi:prepilin-type N-terminal cleavage/methylation domain-containing protein
MKRGFNLIELAVVFLLIGLISAMVYKGKELLDTASIRAEVNKLSKLRNAVATVMTMTSKGNISELAYDNSTSSYDLAPFFDLEILDRADLTVQGSPDNWTVKPCTNMGAKFFFANDNAGSGTMICALHDTYPVDLLCSTEVMSDNQNLQTGAGVAFVNANTGVTHDNLTGMTTGGFDCVQAKPSSINTPKIYGFILFR